MSTLFGQRNCPDSLSAAGIPHPDTPSTHRKLLPVGLGALKLMEASPSPPVPLWYPPGVTTQIGGSGEQARIGQSPGAGRAFLPMAWAGGGSRDPATQSRPIVRPRGAPSLQEQRGTLHGTGGRLGVPLWGERGFRFPTPPASDFCSKSDGPRVGPIHTSPQASVARRGGTWLRQAG